MARARANECASVCTLWSCARGVDEATLIGDDDELCAVSGAELGEEAGDVALDGGDAEEEMVCDLVVGESFGDEMQDVTFALGERAQGLGSDGGA